MRINLAVLLAGCAVLCTAALAWGQDAHRPLMARLEDEASAYVMVAAHRGAHQHVPENSLASIERAIELGVDIVELDIRVTRDGVPVLMHDGTLDRTSTGQGPIEALSWAEVTELRLTQAGGVGLSSEHPPSLEAALQRARGRVLVDLDMKTTEVEAVMAVVQHLDMEAEVIWFDSDPLVLDLARSLDSDTRVMPRAYSAEALESLCARYAPLPVIHIDAGFNTEHSHAVIQSCGARSWINALGDVDTAIMTGDVMGLEALMASGASIIQTDYPERLIEILEAQGRR